MKIRLLILFCLPLFAGDSAKILLGGDTLLGGYHNNPKYGTMLELPQKLDAILEVADVDSAAAYLSQYVRPLIDEADYVFVNLEGPIIAERFFKNEHIEAKEYVLIQHEQTGHILRAMGVNLLSLANNHMYDYQGYHGLSSTILHLDSVLDFVGAGIYHSAYKPSIVEIDEIRIAFFAVNDIVPAEMFNGEMELGLAILPGTRNYESTNRFKVLAKEMATAKQSCDFLVVMMHSGPVSGRELNERQQLLSNALIAAGADVVAGASSHEAQTHKEIRDELGRVQKLVLYGIGNFVFGGRRSDQGTSMLPMVEFKKRGGESWIEWQPNYIFPNNDRSFCPRPDAPEPRFPKNELGE